MNYTIVRRHKRKHRRRRSRPLPNPRRPYPGEREAEHRVWQLERFLIKTARREDIAPRPQWLQLRNTAIVLRANVRRLNALRRREARRRRSS